MTMALQTEISELLQSSLLATVKFLRTEVAHRLDASGRDELAREIYHAADIIVRVVEALRK